MMSCFFTKGPVTDYASATASNLEAFAAYFHAMLNAGVYLAPSQFEAMFVSAVHNDDDLKKTVERNIEKRKGEIVKAEKIVTEAVIKFERTLYSKEVAQMIHGIKEKIYKIAVQESEKTAKKNNLSPEVRKIVEDNAIAIVDKIINLHMSEMHKKIEKTDGRKEDFMKAIKESFKTYE